MHPGELLSNHQFRNGVVPSNRCHDARAHRVKATLITISAGEGVVSLEALRVRSLLLITFFEGNLLDSK